MKNIFILFLAISLFACSQKKEPVKGQGEPVEEFLNLKGFDEIVFTGQGLLKVRSETETFVLVKEYPNLFEYLDAYVKNRVLYVGFKDKYRVENSVLEISVTTPSIKKIISNGTGDMYILDVQDGETLSAVLNGAGKIDIQNGKFNDLDIQVNGAGNFLVSNSTCDQLKLAINGVGNCDSYGLSCNDADVEINGAGSAKVSVVQNLDVKINGAGSLSYMGDPKVNSKITGAGRVDKK